MRFKLGLADKHTNMPTLEGSSLVTIEFVSFTFYMKLCDSEFKRGRAYIKLYG